MDENPLNDIAERPVRTRARVRPRRRWGRVVLGVLLFLVVVGAVGAVVVGYLLMVADSEAAKVPPGQPVEVVIAPGSSTAVIADTLVTAGVIDNALVFRLKARSSETDSVLKAGTYALKTGMENEAVLAKLAKGPDIVYYDITIPEGFTAAQIAARFAKRAHVSEDEMLMLVTSGAQRYSAQHPYLVNAYAGSLEGYLFPATYRVKKGTTAEQIVEMMLDKFDAEIATVDLSHATSKKLTFEDVVTIASLIEREAQLEREFPLVSSVVYNRLRIGMRLQLCATVIYKMPPGTKRVTYDDLKVDTPYNTYIHAGLPPGPISNPGIKALKAAAAPKESKYLYYVLTGQDGSHTFASNYADFQRAVAVNRAEFVNR